MARAEQAQQEEKKEVNANLEPDTRNVQDQATGPESRPEVSPPNRVMTDDHGHDKHEKKRSATIERRA